MTDTDKHSIREGALRSARGHRAGSAEEQQRQRIEEINNTQHKRNAGILHSFFDIHPLAVIPVWITLLLLFFLGVSHDR